MSQPSRAIPVTAFLVLLSLTGCEDRSAPQDPVTTPTHAPPANAESTAATKATAAPNRDSTFPPSGHYRYEVEVLSNHCKTSTEQREPSSVALIVHSSGEKAKVNLPFANVLGRSGVARQDVMLEPGWTHSRQGGPVPRCDAISRTTTLQEQSAEVIVLRQKDVFGDTSDCRMGTPPSDCTIEVLHRYALEKAACDPGCEVDAKVSPDGVSFDCTCP